MYSLCASPRFTGTLDGMPMGEDILLWPLCSSSLCESEPHPVATGDMAKLLSIEVCLYGIVTDGGDGCGDVTISPVFARMGLLAIVEYIFRLYK